MNSNECHMIPAAEIQCVWMTTGLISYKLCTRNYRCEECLFDQAMRDEAAVACGRSSTKAVQAEPLPDAADPLDATGSLFFNRHHCWARVEDPEQVRIGIDGILARLLSHIKAVALPRAGETVTRGQCFAHIIQQKHILPLISPITGSVQSVNERLMHNRELLVRNSWEDGWLVSVQPDNLELDLRALLCGRPALDWYHKSEQAVIETSSAIFNRHGHALGPTLPDGGEPAAGLADRLTPEQYCRIIEALARIDDPA
ncbi:glycine cleavage system protein H [Thermodesulfobacteriota bacterium]